MEWISNGPRSNLEGGLVPGGRSGQDAKLFLQNHIQTVGLTLFVLLLGIIVSFFLLRRRTRKKSLSQEAA